MNTRKKLLEGVKDLLAVETIAKDNYEEDTITFNDRKLVETIEKIKEDEERHIRMIKSIIVLIEKN